jgi:hypothetical protein
LPLTYYKYMTYMLITILGNLDSKLLTCVALERLASQVLASTYNPNDIFAMSVQFGLDICTGIQ